MGLARRLAAGAAGVLVAVALAAGAAGAAWAGTRAASGAPTADAGSRVVSAAPAAREAADDAASPAGQRRTVLIGTGGIGWDDVSEATTPALWRAAGQASTSLGAVITRSVRAGACPVDGWLAVSSGGRAADAATKGAADLDVPTDCATLAAPVDGTVPGWQAYRKLASASGYDPPLGQLGDLIAAYDTAHAAGTGAPFAVGIGPGAAIALADSAGHVQGAWEAAASTAAGLAAQVTRALEGSAVIVVVDAGGLRGGAAGGARLTALDQRLGAALAAAGKAAAAPRVTLASLWDRSRPALGLALDADPATPSAGLLGSTATDRPAVTVTTDFHAELAGAVLAAARRLPPVPASIRTAVTSAGGTLRADPLSGADRADPRHRVAELASLTGHAAAARAISVPFYTAYLVLALLVLLLLLVHVARGRPLGRARATVALIAGAVPAGSFAANAAPWWPRGGPWTQGLTYAGLTLAAAAVLTAAALGVARLARRARGTGSSVLFTAAGLVAAATWALIAVDALTGSHLGWNAPLGYHALQAGRLHGLNNGQYALLATAAFVALAALLAGRARRTAVITIAAVGLLTVLVDGLPTAGDDFGGPPALVLGTIVAALVAARMKLTWRRILVAVGAAAAAVIALSLADYARGPGRRTHIGDFVAQLLSGQAGPTLARKLAAWWEIARLTLPLLVVLALVAWLLWRGMRRSGLPAAYARAHRFAPAAMAGLVVTLVVAMLTNDSALAIGGLGLALGGPLLVAGFAGLRPARNPQEAL